MERIAITKGVSGGEIVLPPSKSVAHRAIICAALSKGSSIIHNIDNSKDMIATMNFIKALGRKFKYENKTLIISGSITENQAEVDCLESGSTLRFIIPILAALGIKSKFIGKGRLPDRPIGIYTQILKGVQTKGLGLPFFIDGKLKNGIFEIPGDISSQFITGLLLALPLLDGDSKIYLTTELESESYVNITLDVMKSFGVYAEKTSYGYKIKGNQKYVSTEYTVEADWSQAAFFISMGAFSKQPIILKGLNPKSEQGDKKCVDIFKKMFINIQQKNNDYIVSKPNFRVEPIEVNVNDIPDMVPALACTLALANGVSKITGAKRLRLKESDRLKSVAQAINNLGGKVTELEDSLVIEGVTKLFGSEVNSYNDHRILMAVSALREVCKGDIILSEPHCVEKSYPSFYMDFKGLGGDCNVINLG